MKIKPSKSVEAVLPERECPACGSAMRTDCRLDAIRAHLIVRGSKYGESYGRVYAAVCTDCGHMELFVNLDEYRC